MNLKKGCLIVLGIMVILTISFLFGAKWFIKEAFGTKYKTVEIENSIGKLICEEEYNADMAAVFYDVDFKLETNEKQLIDLGKLHFQRENWQKEFELNENENWYYLSSNQSRIYDLILTNKSSNENLSFNIKESKPRNKWNKRKNISIDFKVDSIKQDFIYVTYKYQNTEFASSIKSQTVEFKIDRPNNSLNIMKNTELK